MQTSNWLVSFDALILIAYHLTSVASMLKKFPIAELATILEGIAIN